LIHLPRRGDRRNPHNPSLVLAMSDDIDAQIRAAQIARNKQSAEKASLVGSVSFDTDLYSEKGAAKFEGYSTSLPMNLDEDEDEGLENQTKKLSSYTVPRQILEEMATMGEDEADPMADIRPSRKISDRESEYHARRLNRQLSPERVDAFSGKAASSEARSYGEVMREAELNREHAELQRKLQEKQKEDDARRQQTDSSVDLQAQAQAQAKAAVERAKAAAASAATGSTRKRRWDQEGEKKSEWEEDDSTSTAGAKSSKWDETPKADAPARKRNRWDETPVEATTSAWDATPRTDAGGVTPGGTKRSRWDETPVGVDQYAATPIGNLGLMTPVAGQAVPMTPEAANAMRWEKEIDYRNRYLSDEELDTMFPTEGYKILEPPATYMPIRTPARKLMATPTPMGQAGFMMQEEDRSQMYDVPPEIPGVGGLQFFKPEDMQHFGKLLDKKDELELSVEELKERKIMRTLLKIKNGTPPMRKTALRQITDKAREFGAGPLFNQILPLLMSPTLEDQERHLLVKVIDRILYKLDDLVRPYVHKILVVIEPLLIDEDYYARVEGREIISNLSKAAGLATMIATMRPDIDHVDEYVRNTTARAFSVVASALGIPALLPFLKAVCRSKKSWQARHTGIKIVQQIAILLGCAVLPHLKSLVDAIAHGLEDEQQKVRTITALAIAALAEAAAPYGIESFDIKHRGKAIGCIIPLMDAEYANYYTKESPDEEMKKIVLKVVKQCSATDGVEPQYIKEEILPEFFKHFWQLVETTVELAQRVGVAEIVSKIVEDLKDESEPYRKMVMETIDKVVTLIDEQTVEDVVMLNGFGTVQICSTILAKVRQQAADLISRIAIVMRTCGEEKLMGQLGVVLYEYLGEEYPEVLGSILRGLKSIVNDLLPRLTPILKNRHEKVQENCIDLVGRIADRGAEFVSAREWMRICFELLDMLKAHKKGIRRATVNTFGYIAKAIGPQDVLATLLNNLKVQERQNRVCTTVAIAIVAETCSPFTVLPALMNEYRVPELNVQNGVLKSLSFLFEYIGEMGKDYCYAVTPLLEDALMDRDLVHRQTACTTVKHMALGVVGLGCEDALQHLLNHVWPNIFETSPHVINAVMEAIDGLRVALGPATLTHYVLQGLFHPARRVREIYWKIYNNLYIGAQDAIVAYYPRIEDDTRNTYERYDLDLMI
ncbi:armadillo-type protein, partial [Geranomyces variabilis]